MSMEERELVRKWMATYEPAADLIVLPSEVVAKSTRRSLSAAVPRTSDLTNDLHRAVAQLVDLTN